jgi:tartrate dehydrogenase/decarboxylase / D-malate dehydrogenase
MKHYDIANIPGDGVGEEVAREAVKVLDAAAKKFGFKVSYETFDWGCDYYLKHGEMNPANMLEILKGSDAIFLGCIGDASKVPDHVSLPLLLKIRKGFDQYVNLRPIQLYPGVKSPISTATPETVDMIAKTPRVNTPPWVASSNKGRPTPSRSRTRYSPTRAASA